VYINSFIKSLSKNRKIFVSEADFQFALAWEIKQNMPQAEVRLESCVIGLPYLLTIGN
jgi:hypothetical protein